MKKEQIKKETVKEKIFKKLKENGVVNLKAFGYDKVTVNNIATDKVYKLFFLNMLNSNLGQDERVDVYIKELINMVQ